MAVDFAIGSNHQCSFRSGIDQTTRMSLSCWTYPRNTPVGSSTKTIICNGSNPRNFLLDYRDASGLGVLEMSLTVSSTFVELQFGTGALCLPLNTWSHVGWAIDYSGTWTRSGYINGISQTVTVFGTASGTPDASDTNRFIGATSSGGSGAWGGGLAELAVWNGYLSAREFYALAKGAVRPHQVRREALVAYWPLDGYKHIFYEMIAARHGGIINFPSLLPSPPQVSAAPILLDWQKPPQNTFLPVPPVAKLLMGQIWM
jgi:Concanavalin A-like lectin/glucanases superfamily